VRYFCTSAPLQLHRRIFELIAFGSLCTDAMLQGTMEMRSQDRKKTPEAKVEVENDIMGM
jgi:hypothetical protein